MPTGNGSPEMEGGRRQPKGRGHARRDRPQERRDRADLPPLPGAAPRPVRLGGPGHGFRSGDQRRRLPRRVPAAASSGHRAALPGVRTGRGRNPTARVSAAFLPGLGRALEIRRAVFRRGRSSGEPQAAEFEILENAAGEGPEAVVRRACRFGHSFSSFRSAITISKRTSSLGAGRLSWLCMGVSRN